MFKFSGSKVSTDTVGAFIIRIGFWGPSYYTHNSPLYYTYQKELMLSRSLCHGAKICEPCAKEARQGVHRQGFRVWGFRVQGFGFRDFGFRGSGSRESVSIEQFLHSRGWYTGSPQTTHLACFNSPEPQRYLPALWSTWHWHLAVLL